ncbi:MAG: leucine-rich repeat domain-containing protein, partial [Aphanocapsa feldmannii 277cV]
MVAVTDDDKVPALVLTPPSLTVAEGDGSSYTVALASAPTAAVTVTVSSGSGVTADTDAATNGNQNTLSFSTANWNIPQTVEVSAEQDSDAVDDTVTLAHSTSGGDYGLVTANLSVTVSDDDKAPALVFSPESLTVVGGSSGSYTVALAGAPTAAVTVTVSAGAGVTLDTDADTNGNQNTLTFSTANWSTPQTVDVSVEQDVDDNVTLSHSVSGGDYGSVTANFSVNVKNICERMDALNSNGLTCNISSKGITSFSSGDFDGLSDLRYLYMSNNALSSLPEDIFDGLSDLRYLYMSNNALSSLPE